MMLSNLPINSNRSSGTGPAARPPLHERLFGEHSKWFYVAMGLWFALAIVQLMIAVLYRPDRLDDLFRHFAFPLFILLQGSPHRRIRSVAAGVVAGSFWHETDIGMTVAVTAGVASAIISYAGGRLSDQAREQLKTLTRERRTPTVLRLAFAEFIQAPLVVVPVVLVAHRYLIERGWNPTDVQLLIGAVMAVGISWAVRRLRDSLPFPARA
jgi:hypothetical protein